MKKFILLLLVFSVHYSSLFSQSSCLAWNEYVDFKNTGGTAFYTLTGGSLEKAAQTYYYSGPGSIISVQINGRIPSGSGWSLQANLNVQIYNVDANNRPTTLISSKALTWYYIDTAKTVSFGSGGLSVNNNFAVVVEMASYFVGQKFDVKFTGTGEGNSEDLASRGGTSTGGNWLSLLPANDGDLYLIPKMNHFIDAGFAASTSCNVAVGQLITFTDTTKMTLDSMFNTITLAGYTGGKTLYEWDFGDGSAISTMQNPTHSYSSPGAYTVTLTTYLDDWPIGNSFCTDLDSLRISVGLGLSASTTNLNCYNDASGAIALTALGGDSSAYLYSLDGINWQQDSTFQNLASGGYTVYVKDKANCVQSNSALLNEPGPILIASPIAVSSATCGNPDGSLLAVAAGGSGTLSYSIDSVNFQATGAFNALSSGNYKVYVKDTNACVATLEVALDNSPAPSLVLQSYSNVSCFGGSDGTITIIGSGGIGALQYSLDGVNFQSSGTFTGLSDGFYTPTVKDAGGCIGTIPCMLGVCGVYITAPNAISFEMSQLPTTCNGSSNGGINVYAASGGTGTLTYSLNGINYQSGTTFSGLPSATYTVRVKDVAGCIASDTISVQEPSPLAVTIDSVVHLTCNNSHNGELHVSVTGGDGNYNFSIDGTNYFPSGEFSGLNAGTYVVTVLDGNSCLGIAIATINQPNAISAAITAGNSTCGNANATILAIASGGSGAGYSYSIDGGLTSNTTGSFVSLVDSTYLMIITDSSGCINLFSTTVSDSDGPSIVSTTSTNVTCNGGSDGSITVTSVTGGTGAITYSVDGGPFSSSNLLSSLSAGPHTVVVKDANGCTGEISDTLSEPSPFAIVLSSTNVTCNNGNDGSISVIAAGGAGTLAYSLDGVNYQSTNTFNNLIAGIYSVTVRDGAGCTGSEMISITEPSPIVVTIGTLNIDCFGNTNGAINASAKGGTGPSQFSLDGITYQSSGSFTGLAAGNYTLYVQDSVGCSVGTNISITEPGVLSYSSIASNILCTGGNNGFITINVSGGVTPYVYSWSNLATTKDLFNLVAGSYNVTVTDANGCTLTNNYTLTQPSSPLIINGTVTNASGPSTPDGSINIIVTGGTQPYSFSWSNGSTTEDISTLLPGIYIINVTDVNGCSHSTSFTVGFTVGLDDPITESQLIIYPNPVNEVINIEIPNNKIADEIQLMDMTGKVLYKSIPKSSITSIDASPYAEGLYLLNFKIGNRVIMKKVMISR